jgi:2-polyprenyl-3-methyl-5-hydroxy-6-metoxy-1,4-benzoquinol methylase
MRAEHDPSERDDEYAQRLSNVQGAWWKRLLRVQTVYARHLRRLDLGFVLDVGCGVGRSLRNLEGNGVGVDVSEAAVRRCREQGFEAYSKPEFDSLGIGAQRTFDSVLFAHVLEHMTRQEAIDLLDEYRRFVRPDGIAVLICPQERGYASDDSHVTFLDAGDMVDVASEAGLAVERSYSFPFPRRLGRLFVYNESIVVARVGG